MEQTSEEKARRPAEVATRETLRFVRAHLSGGAQRLLEVGCGNGALAAALQADGHTLVALDADAEAVAEARRRGVEARHVAWLDFEEAPFDAVLFTRSLHHLHPLDAALDQAKRLLKPSGVLVVEDFAYRDVDAFTAAWLYDLLSLLDACDVLQADSFGHAILAGGGALAPWQHAHAHELHTAQAMAQAIQERFQGFYGATAPYLYRYVSRMVAETEAGAAIVEHVLALETKLGMVREKSLLGRRFVARKHDAEGY